MFYFLLIVYLAVFSGSGNTNNNEKLVGNLEEARKMKDFAAAKDRIRAMKDGQGMDGRGIFGGPNMKGFMNNRFGDDDGNGKGFDENNMPDMGNIGGLFRKNKKNLADISPENMAEYEKYAKKMKKMRPRGGPEYGRPNREDLMGAIKNGRNADMDDIPREVPRGGVDREYKEKWKQKYGDGGRGGGGGMSPEQMREYREQMKADRLRQRDGFKDGFKDRMAGGRDGLMGGMDERMQEKFAARERMREERERARNDRMGDRADRGERREGNGGISPEGMRQYREQLKADRMRQRFGDKFQDGQGAFGAFADRGRGPGPNDNDFMAGDGSDNGAGARGVPGGGRDGPRSAFGGGGFGPGGNLGDRFASAKDRLGGRNGPGFPRGNGDGDGNFNNFREQLRNGMLNDQDIDKLIQEKKDRLRQRYADDEQQQQ